MAIQHIAHRMASRIFSARATRPSFPGIGSGACSRRFFCSKSEEARGFSSSVPPRRQSIWAELKEWRPVEKFYVACGTVILSAGLWAFGELLKIGLTFLCFRSEYFISKFEARKKKRLEEKTKK